jgi:hypothetical protein
MTLSLDIGAVRDCRGPIETEPAALLMRLGGNTLRGSNPRSSATDQHFPGSTLLNSSRFRGSALVSPHNARTLRHARISTTQVYVHALEDVPRAGADVMDRVLEGLRQR